MVEKIPDEKTVAKTATEMFVELIERGYVTPSTIEPTRFLTPTAYVSVPTSLAFATPPIPNFDTGEGIENAKLGSRPKRDQKRKKRSSNG